jgi:lipopolysaccharide export LptBFGC system permease protein LptF
MSDGPEWFAPKRYGYGAGLPIAWQGWAVLAIYIAVIGLLSLWLAEKPIAFIGALIPPTALLILITAKTTRGGWRWRSGSED